jgi:hypothetical protein
MLIIAYIVLLIFISSSLLDGIILGTVRHVASPFVINSARGNGWDHWSPPYA